VPSRISLRVGKYSTCRQDAIRYLWAPFLVEVFLNLVRLTAILPSMCDQLLIHFKAREWALADLRDTIPSAISVMHDRSPPQTCRQKGEWLPSGSVSCGITIKNSSIIEVGHLLINNTNSIHQSTIFFFFSHLMLRSVSSKSSTDAISTFAD
jgi:hypothetical protein